MKNYLLSILAMLVSVTSFAQEDLFAGEWVGTNKEGDMKVSLSLNCDDNWQLNPFDEDARCNGFMEVNMVEPGGRESMLVTYELHLVEDRGNEVVMDFIGGRPGVDEGIAGQCLVTNKDGNLKFVGLDQGGKDAMFNGLTLVPEGSGADAIADAAEDAGVPLWTKIKNLLTTILVSGLFLFVIGHMGYVWFKGARYKEKFTVDGMKNERYVAGLPEEMTEREVAEAWSLMDEAFQTWTVVETTEEGEFRKPTKMKQITRSVMLIDQVIAMCPTDAGVVERLNELTDVINSGEERHFDGSVKLIGLGVIVAILMYWMAGMGMTVSTLASTGLYYIASRTPQFLIDKRALRGGGNIHNGIMAGVFAMLAGAQTVRTVYTYSDGHKEYDDDHSQHWIALVLGFVVLVVLAMMMMFWALLNYVRNYVLYI
ncbi:MAG: hypothetical protein NC080_04335 [Paraprevotella sp.]|nr:hypothetical protein [Paraprevotella sp.]